ncbi:sensor histidine kinase [Actinoallomurus purpureus]|uniref:sensor histidine kinase n=1 Tax=Actinoallomurus purpureus TaxID=478114 RepID=UPI00209353F1|nr:sensor histidine kinase [Actinoallomurus purpureus]MCO6008026.1 sensor histidine kinase [Actinoallomurus purpureus]
MITSWQRYVRGHPHVFTVAVALLLFAASFPGSMLSRPHPSGRVQWPAVLLSGIACTALLWHHSRPRTTVTLTAAGVVAMAALGYLLTPLLMAPVMAALYSLAIRTDRSTTRAYAIATATLLVGTSLIADPTSHSLYLKTANPFAWVVLPAVVGSSVRLRRAYLEALRARAEHAERTREEEARHRVTEERMRIARELHDVVAHHLALANAQAGTAAHLARTRSDQAQKILADLTGTTSSALRELKATVGLLRQAGDPDAPVEPAPGLAQLPGLIASLQSGGLTVTVTTEGEPQRLSPGLDLTAFRIVQEALTNVTKHAPTRTARVRLSYSHDRLTITVTDDGGAAVPSAPASGGGFGLIGMRERALSVGGLFLAGRRPEGGFEVTTELPLHPRNPEEAPTV